MAYQVLYRTYRPKRFEEVVGQDYIVKTLKNAIKTNKIAHAYLFAGPKGTGKTTVAKLFAKAINCANFTDEPCEECDNCKAYQESNHPDIIELDAASNNKVDDIREIVKEVSFLPILGKYKVYIIDEVHMLSNSAFNAFLKTLEEPPKHVIFILATTDPQKIIPTVLSRCQRYNFSNISNYEIIKKMKEILEKEQIEYDEKALNEIAIMASGGMRDALSILEQCLAYNDKKITIEDVEHIYGLSSTNTLVDLYLKINNNETSAVIDQIRKMYQEGIEIKRLALNLIEVIKDSLIYSDNAKTQLLTRLNASQAQDILNNVNTTKLIDDIEYLENLLNNSKNNFLAHFELALIKMANIKEKKIIKKDEPIETKENIIENKEQNDETQVIEEHKVNSPAKDLILEIMFDADRNLKINDMIIYNRLDLYRFETEKRKFYQLLADTELFASNNDAIIICANKTKADNINSQFINEELYYFISEEFGIDKMLYAINYDERKELIETFRNTDKSIIKKPNIKKYQKKTEEKLSSKDRLINVFGDKVKVED